MSQYHYTAPVYSGYSGYPQQAYAAPIGYVSSYGRTRRRHKHNYHSPVQTVPVVPGQYMVSCIYLPYS